MMAMLETGRKKNHCTNKHGDVEKENYNDIKNKYNDKNICNHSTIACASASICDSNSNITSNINNHMIKNSS